MAPKPKVAVFIVGCGHSGTTLLARILATHPSVYCPPYETNAFLGDKEPRWRIVAKLLIKAARSKKPVMIEKSPPHIHHAARILNVLPKAKFIVAARDGRDTVASLLKRYSGDSRRAFERWSRDSKASKELLDRGLGHLWRYEDFIESPQSSLDALCDFIGISRSGELLTYHQKPVRWGLAKEGKSAHTDLRNSQVNNPIQDNRGKWKTDLPVEMVGRFEHGEARQLMAYFGYV